MATLTIKNLPDDLYAALREAAAAHRRSIIAEATVLLERGLGRRSVSEADLLAEAERLRTQAATRLTPELLNEALREGRA